MWAGGWCGQVQDVAWVRGVMRDPDLKPLHEWILLSVLPACPCDHTYSLIWRGSHSLWRPWEHKAGPAVSGPDPTGQPLHTLTTLDSAKPGTD